MLNWSEQMEFAKGLRDLAGDTAVQNPIVTLIEIDLQPAATTVILASNAAHIFYVLDLIFNPTSNMTAANLFIIREYASDATLNVSGSASYGWADGNLASRGEKHLKDSWNWGLDLVEVGGASIEVSGKVLRFDFT